MFQTVNRPETSRKPQWRGEENAKPNLRQMVLIVCSGYKAPIFSIIIPAAVVLLACSKCRTLLLASGSACCRPFVLSASPRLPGLGIIGNWPWIREGDTRQSVKFQLSSSNCSFAQRKLDAGNQLRRLPRTPSNERLGLSRTF